MLFNPGIFIFLIKQVFLYFDKTRQPLITTLSGTCEAGENSSSMIPSMERSHIWPPLASASSTLCYTSAGYCGHTAHAICNKLCQLTTTFPSFSSLLHRRCPFAYNHKRVAPVQVLEVDDEYSFLL